jgi:hypothetical protein
LLNDTINFRNSAALHFLGSTAGDLADPAFVCRQIGLRRRSAGRSSLMNLDEQGE